MKRYLISFIFSAVFLLFFSGCKVNADKVISIPHAVTELKAVSEEGKIVLTWKDPEDKDLLGVKIYNGEMQVNRAVSFEDGILVGKGLQHYEISNLIDGEAYKFKVSAINIDLAESSYTVSNSVVFVEKKEPLDNKLLYVSSVEEGVYTVYHMQQDFSGKNSIVNHILVETETEKQISEESDIANFDKNYPGFTVSSMIRQNDSIIVLYERNTTTYTFNSGCMNSFEDDSKTKIVSGLYGSPVIIPEVPAYIIWSNYEEQELPETFGVENLIFDAAWKDGFIKIEREENNSFYVSPYETTYSFYNEVSEWAKTEENGYVFESIKQENKLNFPVGDSWRNVVVWCNAASEKYGFTPVYELNGEVLKNAADADSVTVNTSANGYRLPTFEEWQYAAAGGENYIYSGSDDPAEVAWYGNDGKPGGNTDSKGTCEVGLLKPNGYGLYDMTGNVWEWVQDQYEEDPLMRKMCGGSYWGVAIQITEYDKKETNKNRPSFGFRLVRNVE